MRARPHDRSRRSRAVRGPTATALAGAALVAVGGAGAGVPTPADVRVLGEVPLDAGEAGWVLDLADIDALDAVALDARGEALPVRDGPVTIVAHDVLAGLLAWEAGRGVGDGAHAPALTATLRPAPFGAAEPAVGAALAGGPDTGNPPDRLDALDLSIEGPSLSTGSVTVEAPGLSFERRTLYQATTGRLFVDFRLRHRDPVHGTAALEDEARTAAAIARMRTLSTVVVEPTGGTRAQAD